jgi:adenine-specific DNA methylase
MGNKNMPQSTKPIDSSFVSTVMTQPKIQTTLISQLPETEREAFRQSAVEIRRKFVDQNAFWLALAGAFEELTSVQEISIPEVGRKLEEEIFDLQLLGRIED